MDSRDDDEDMRKGVIDQMMGELDDVTADSLKRKPEDSAKGVEISITVSPKSGMQEGEDTAEDKIMDDACMDPDCEDPEHDHSMRDSVKPEGDSDYISQLIKKLG